MSDLVVSPEDRFSDDAAHLLSKTAQTLNARGAMEDYCSGNFFRIFEIIFSSPESKAHR